MAQPTEKKNITVTQPTIEIINKFNKIYSLQSLVNQEIEEMKNLLNGFAQYDAARLELENKLKAKPEDKAEKKKETKKE